MAQATTHKAGILASLYSIAGDKSVDSETLTVACFKNFPSLFSMDLFKEYPRMDRITKRISDLINDKLVKENADGTYTLTDKGLYWVKANPDLVRHAQESIHSEKDSITSQNMTSEELKKETAKLQRTEAYKKFKEGKLNTVNIADFMDFLKIDIYSTRQLFDRKIKRIGAICSNEPEFKEIFEFMSNKFGKEYTSFKYEIDKLIG